MEIYYRTALITDIPELIRLTNQLGYHIEKDQLIKNLHIILTNNENVVFVAVKSDQLVGWIHAQSRYLIESPPYIEISGLIVDIEYRGLSIGKTLIQYCEKWSSEKDFHEIRVRTNSVRTDAIKFYSRIGFINTKTQHVFKKEIFD
ncbi:GNAT family N-acetyltransferase [Bacillus sp. EAC]|uniref:GNAT family N-acetyltransferase n=1 Tax=Bacillus sp. EAC TaxID=1978338 RepID=UPI000B42EF32|nr:GNAT family N-acetyltransferase [Bacillus sp. EAC]